MLEIDGRRYSLRELHARLLALEARRESLAGTRAAARECQAANAAVIRALAAEYRRIDLGENEDLRQKRSLVDALGREVCEKDAAGVVARLRRREEAKWAEELARKRGEAETAEREAAEEARRRVARETDAALDKLRGAWEPKVDAHRAAAAALEAKAANAKRGIASARAMVPAPPVAVRKEDDGLEAAMRDARASYRNAVGSQFEEACEFLGALRRARVYDVREMRRAHDLLRETAEKLGSRAHARSVALSVSALDSKIALLEAALKEPPGTRQIDPLQKAIDPAVYEDLERGRANNKRLVARLRRLAADYRAERNAARDALLEAAATYHRRFGERLNQ